MSAYTCEKKKCKELSTISQCLPLIIGLTWFRSKLLVCKVMTISRFYCMPSWNGILWGTRILRKLCVVATFSTQHVLLLTQFLVSPLKYTPKDWALSPREVWEQFRMILGSFFLFSLAADSTFHTLFPFSFLIERLKFIIEFVLLLHAYSSTESHPVSMFFCFVLIIPSSPHPTPLHLHPCHPILYSFAFSPSLWFWGHTQ